jgi:flagellar basal-body rod protein FlgB
MTAKLFASLRGLERVVDYHLERHKVLSSNLANANTPGYQPRELLFRESLADAERMAATHPAHIQSEAQPDHLVELSDVPTGVDRNGVRLERAMAQVAANRLRYEAGIEILRRRLALMRYAARNGGA